MLHCINCLQVLDLPPAHLAQLLRCVEDGLCAQETVLMQSCATLGHFVEFIFKYRNSEEKQGDVRAFLSFRLHTINKKQNLAARTHIMEHERTPCFSCRCGDVDRLRTDSRGYIYTRFLLRLCRRFVRS